MVVEYERLQLLKSEDPAERKRGEEMITPGSIFAAQPDESALAVPLEIAETKLGKVPSDVEAAEAADTLGLETTEPVLEEELDEDEEQEPDQSDAKVRMELLDTDTNIAKAQALKEVAKKERVRTAQSKVYLWLPLTFPPVPEKGTFDVSRLKQSRYFFH